MSSEVGRRELHTRRGILNLKECRGFLFLFFCLAVGGFFCLRENEGGFCFEEDHGMVEDVGR